MVYVYCHWSPPATAVKPTFAHADDNLADLAEPLHTTQWQGRSWEECHHHCYTQMHHSHPSFQRWNLHRQIGHPCPYCFGAPNPISCGSSMAPTKPKRAQQQQAHGQGQVCGPCGRLLLQGHKMYWERSRPFSPRIVFSSIPTRWGFCVFAGGRRIFFFALCCLGRCRGGAPKSEWIVNLIWQSAVAHRVKTDTVTGNGQCKAQFKQKCQASSAVMVHVAKGEINKTDSMEEKGMECASLHFSTLYKPSCHSFQFC